ncbi:Mitotic checkpoint protein bub3 [Gracilariopsis chorda]|uniref:Mitotic checkpoint protein bub3 n=1 Tax=Gracilariopsis chorda TaxID=448386 RepID=A0A2V3J186_9FLOR|nr:Mitotic checkpoint protein bub3 [Gracilariopsis chorda]|eukprot:PXF48124.1 Mitotic checkpoint protein bub3 [Gracilariopsis chorda]
MTSSANATIVLDPSAQDAVSRVSFAPDSSQILVSSWAGTIALYESNSGTMRTESNVGSVVLDSTWVDNTVTTAGTLDGTVLLAIVRETGMDCRILGLHTAAVRAVSAIPNHHIIASGSWDQYIQLWDIRSNARISAITAGGKVYGTAPCGPNGIVFINSTRQIRLIDFRRPDLFLYDVIPPTLSYQLRGVSASRDGKQIVVGSTEGRVAVEYIDDPARCYSFKCHRVDNLAYPVNCISHNPRYSSFTTGGADGQVSFWDGDAKKRISQFSRYPTSVASLDFDAEVRRIAVAVSYTFEEGEKDHPPDEVIVRAVNESHFVTRDATPVAR